MLASLQLAVVYVCKLCPAALPLAPRPTRAAHPAPPRCIMTFVYSLVLWSLRTNRIQLQRRQDKGYNCCTTNSRFTSPSRVHPTDPQKLASSQESEDALWRPHQHGVLHAARCCGLQLDLPGQPAPAPSIRRPWLLPLPLPLLPTAASSRSLVTTRTARG